MFLLVYCKHSCYGLFTANISPHEQATPDAPQKASLKSKIDNFWDYNYCLVKACNDAEFTGPFARDFISNALKHVFPDILPNHQRGMKEPNHAMGCDVVGTPGAAERVRAKVAIVRRSVAATFDQLSLLYPRNGGVTSSSAVAVVLGMDTSGSVPVPPSRQTSSEKPTGVVPHGNLPVENLEYFRPFNVRFLNAGMR